MKVLLSKIAPLKTLSTLLLSLLLGATTLVAAESEVSISYAAVNPDYKPFDSTYGLALSGQYGFENGLFLMGSYNDTDFQGSGPLVGSTLFDSWAEAGIGYSFSYGEGTFYSLITADTVHSEVKSFDGYGAHFGYKTQFSEQWTGLIQLGYIETDFNDLQLIGKLYYQLFDNFSLTLGIRDYDKWDYTNYEAGVVFHF